MSGALNELLGQLAGMQWSDYLDIILVTALLYFLLPMVRSTGATRILRVVGFVIVVTWLTDLLQLYTLNFLLNAVLEVGLIAIVILFQPELRRMLDQLTNVKLKKFFGSRTEKEEMVPVIAQVVSACATMSKEKVGALIVFGRNSVLDDYTKTGTTLDAQVTEQLLRNIFFPKAALHDGATVIQDGRIVAAGCVLPLSESNRLHADLGTRHRAGVGLTEISDSVVVIVSEETGAISVSVGGILKRYLTPQTLEKLLRNELCPQETGINKDDNQIWINLKDKMKTKKKKKEETNGEANDEV